MSRVHATENNFIKTAAQENEALSPLAESQETRLPTGLSLHQLFSEDILHSHSQAVEPLPQKISFWNRFINWLKGPAAQPASPITSSKPSVKQIETKSETISFTPILEPPAYLPDDFKTIPLATSSKKDTKAALTSREVEEAFSLMSEQTIEAIMFIIFKIQIELEKENAQVSEKTFSKYLDFQKLQQKVLLEIKDVLVKDEKFAQFFSSAQKVTLVAHFVAGFVALLFGPQWGILSTAAAASLTTAAASLTALTLGSKAYFQRLMNEHRATHEEYNHYEEYYRRRGDDSRERLISIAEVDTVFKERWIQLLRRSDKMRKLVFKK